jgi:holliday junction DNA helicase RuvA
MIARITGTIVDIFEKGVVIETGGIGYAVYTPAAPAAGTTTTLHTHLVIRDDAHELYGFESPEEKSLFSTLIGVSGVGPKTALHMLSLYPIGALARSIKDGDAKAISMVPGIGKKTAEKIVIDLKDKMDAFASTANGVHHDLVDALISLGYKDHQIRPILSAIDTALPIERQITAALQLLQK